MEYDEDQPMPKSIKMEDVRCPHCRRLVAKRREDGGFEVRHRGILQAIVDVGVLTCIVCSEVVHVVNERKVAISPSKMEIRRSTHDVFSCRVVPRGGDRRRG